MIRIRRTGDFDKQLEELLKEEPDKMDLVLGKIKIFKKNPADTRLDCHLLTGRLEGKYAMSITDEIRIVYEWLGRTNVRFLAVGGHRKVYKKS